MASVCPTRLLGPEDPAPFEVVGYKCSGPFLVTVDHASFTIPKKLGKLGLPDQELKRHIAYDIGALDVAKIVAASLNAPLVYQNFSRLVIDCNRKAHASDLIPIISEYTEIPGNKDLGLEDRSARMDEIHKPYHQAISDMLDNWQGKKPIFLAIHSCTPVYKGQKRDLEIGCLYGTDGQFAHKVLDALRSQIGDAAADNEPYTVSMENDYSVPVHAEARKLPYVEVEFRQDLVSDPDGVKKWARHLLNALESANET
nr:N-formylglutamate amidohydrolase [uncultured Cohaesibacter sp.]